MNKTLLLNALETFIAKVDPDWKTLHRIADSKVPSVREAFLKAVAETQGAISLKEVEQALAAGNIIAAEAAIDWTRFGYEFGKVGTILTNVMIESGEFAATRAGEKFGFKSIVFEGFKPGAPVGEIVGYFNLRNPAAEEWIKEHTGQLITQVTNDTRKAVRSIILDGQVNGISPRQMAREIKQHVGLTDGQAKAVLNYRAKLDKMMAEGKSPFKTVRLTRQKIDELTGKYSKKLLKYRSETIARHETLSASNMGQQNIWRQALEQDLIPITTRRRWSTAKDERVCYLCGPLDGMVVGMEENWSITASKTENSKQVTYTSLTPPLHVACRCAMVLDFG